MVVAARPVRVEEAVGDRLVVVRRFPRGLDREHCRPGLRRRAENALLAVEKRDAPAAVREPAVEPALVRNVVAELRAQHVERRKAGRAQDLVTHLRES